MFYIYSPQGRLFAGSMEKLRRIEKLPKTERSSFKEQPLEQEAEAKSGKHYERYEVSKRAVEQYQSLLKKNAARDAVYHAYQVMSQPVVTLGTEDSWERVLAIFESHTFQVLPILSSSQQVVGTLSRRDFYPTLLANPALIKSKNAVATDPLSNLNTPVVTADPVTDIRRIASVLVEHRLDAIPIVEDSHRLVGIVSRTDILRCATADPPLSLWC